MTPSRRNRQAPAKMDSSLLHAIEAAAERAAKRNANRVMKLITEKLAAVGINAASEEAQIENQKDAAWTRRMRTGSTRLGYAVLAAFFSLCATIIGLVVNHLWIRH